MIKVITQPMRLLAVTIIACLSLTTASAFAACISPAGNAGDIVYSSNTTTMAYCNGTNWIAMGQNAATSFGTLTTNSFCTATSGTAVACTTASTGTGNVVLSTSPTLVTPVLGTPTSVTLTNGTGLPISSGVSGLATGIATFLGTSTSANLAAALTDETGTGAAVFATSPTFVTPVLGTPTSVTLTNGTGLPISSGVSGLGAGIATFLGTSTSANLAAALTDETGTGAAVFATSPTFVTPVLGTPTSVTLTNGTGLPISSGVSGLGAGIAAFLATPTSANLAAALTDETGTGAAVFAGSPTFTGTVTGVNSTWFGTSASTYPLTATGAALGTTLNNTTNLLSLINTNSNVNYLNFQQIRTTAGSSWTTATTRIQNVTDVTNQSYIDFNPMALFRLDVVR